MSEPLGAGTDQSGPRRELGAALVACLLGSAAVLLAGGASWARVGFSLADGPPVVADAITGRAAAPLAVALGLLGLAAAAAMLATRGRPRRALGGLLTLAGLVVMIDSIRALGRLAALATGTAPAGMTAGADPTAGPWVAAAGGVAIIAAGILALVRGGRWNPMSQRYEAPGSPRASSPAQPATATEDPDAAWRALDRGEDPTVSA